MFQTNAEEDPYITVEFKPKSMRSPPPITTPADPEGLYTTITELKQQ